jgi:manganese/zinc/iron transport system substrate-binding protein
LALAGAYLNKNFNVNDLKMKTTIIKTLGIIGILFAFVYCNPNKQKSKSDKLNIITTTTIITDLVKEIGGEHINVEGLMGAGVDPHLYKASEGDVNKLFNADVVFYNGLHLEGKMEDIFERMEHQGKAIISVSDTIDRNLLISSKNFASNYDPHIWFSIANWKLITAYVTNKLVSIDPANKETYLANGKIYLARLDSAEQMIANKIKELAPEKRVLITAHDAFNYFGKEFGFDVIGLQGISTATEAGVQDVQNLADTILQRKVKAIFVESSVPKRNIEALQEAVRARNHNVIIGGSLYSDALGNPGTIEGTYTGMFLYNVNTIVNALKD